MNIKSELKKYMKENSGYLISSNPFLYKKVIEKLLSPFNGKEIDKILAPETKGLFYGPAIAYKINKPFIAAFKSGRIPKSFIISQKYKDYSKKLKSIDLGKITINKGDKILFIDDVFETGESGRAIINLVEQLGGKIVGISIVYNKLNEKDQKFFRKYNLKYIVKMKK